MGGGNDYEGACSQWKKSAVSNQRRGKTNSQQNFKFYVIFVCKVKRFFFERNNRFIMA